MHTEDSPLERTSDLLAKIRALREQAEKAMDRFTCITDYDVRRVVGHGSKAAAVSDETVTSSPAVKRGKKTAPKTVAGQKARDFPPVPPEHRTDDGEEA